ncbi:MAG: hypothetical protein ACI9QL_003252 [Candidatus Omnitrophota bacterium]|jgi:hypothetical protein
MEKPALVAGFFMARLDQEVARETRENGWVVGSRSSERSGVRKLIKNISRLFAGAPSPGPAPLWEMVLTSERKRCIGELRVCAPAYSAVENLKRNPAEGCKAGLT